MNFDYEAMAKNILDIVKQIFDMSNIINGLTIITSIITILGVLHALRQSKLKIYTQYILDNIFIDRKATLCEVSNAIRGENIVINVYGKKGVGKSNFLRFYCDLINHKLKRTDSRILKEQFSTLSEYKSLHLYRSRTFYLEVSGYQNRNDLNNQLSESITGKSGFSNIEVAEKLKKAFPFHRRIIIIFDNVNTSGLESELENIIKIFYSVSNKFCFIIGSVRELNLLGLVNVSHKNIELKNFEENDIKEFMHHNYSIIDCNILADILKLSEGLPILVNLYLKGFKENGVLANNIQVKKYVHQITETLPEKVLKIAQIIALLSITKVNIPIDVLKCIISDFNSEDIIKLEENALIEYHPIKRKIKMHEIFRDFINSFYIMQEQECILKLYRYFKKNSTEYESAYYAILVEDIRIKDLVIPTIEKAISDENYSFLLLFGEHVKNIFGFQSISGNISKNAFYTILLGYLEGLIGVGDYPAAKEIIDKCGLNIRENNTPVQLKLSLLIANLYHLQNQYQEAIGSYEILLNASNNENGGKCEAKCLWGIAHSYRHEGMNYALAELYYNESIKSAKISNQKSIVLKCYFELVTMHILQNKRVEAQNEMNIIHKIFKEIPLDKYINTRIAFKKVQARYIRVFNFNTSIDDLKLLKSVLKEYEIQKKRLQYNTFFDLGEYFRHHYQYAEAIENYTIALKFSRKNHDVNLETMSRLGIIACSVSQKQTAYETIEILKDIIKDCTENHLYTNRIFAKLILDIVQDNELCQETQNDLKYIGIDDKLVVSYADINKIHLILM